ncbi:MAG: enoyl-CoA hydratase/isomerase family protein [Xanthomonadales bacterium]|nr:enoyl-CoA hydratase/isomerase family protein [Xanthomonadales bacterium]ODU93753.1 MAG: enoyl-CoA hydratase [Rhodanobacter sp. SCN 66-43]OJY83283.1 MAG: enoyl-CoA hydratase [Xanthomonadales bacterium 66-474]
MLERIQHEHGILELRLARPPVNALNPELVAALKQAIERAPGEGAEALVLSGSPGLFSAGLDIPALLQLDRAAMRAFWNDFFGVCGALARSPIPVAAAVTGHSPAGGAVLAIFCDWRVMARGEYRIGLNEVQVGLTVPDCIQAALRRLVGTYRAERLLVSGAMLDAEAALAAGMVDELTDVDHVVTRALAWLAPLLQLPRHAMLATRTMARADLAALFADPDRLPVEEFLDGWFAPEAQTTLHALAERLRSKKSG